MDEMFAFLIVIFVVLLIFLNFHFITQNNIKAVVSSINALRVSVNTNTTTIEELTGSISELDARLAALEAARR